MRMVIDRFEGDYVVCERDDRTMLNINKNKLPAEAKEGDVLIVDGDAISIDLMETSKRKEQANQLMEKLFKTNND
jgi:hypothetical protein